MSESHTSRSPGQDTAAAVTSEPALSVTASRENDYIVPALFRGLKILEMFSTSRKVLTTNDFADELGATNSAIYRIVTTLTDMGYLKKIARNTYELGPQVITLGFSYLASRDVVDVVAPHLDNLRDQTTLSCHLSIREGTDAIYLYRAFAAQRMSVNIPIGSRLPCHVSAMGRILLTALDDDGLQQLYRQTRLDDYPPPAPQNLPALKEAIDEARTQGWVESRSDYATAIATGLHDHTGHLVGAINLSGPDGMMNDERRLPLLRGALLDCARHINHELGSLHRR
ncbi:IclR family transcriptional regulator [Cobetia sp. L2A1]|uniref:IclR family transcriptional regulator n=1 Tax=Cobetia sp. L2A1 TaxID=2686360 RepID=UPI00131AD250|nr:IclR family transcriptional regulator [Cobetia sp. L2A1]